MNNTRRNEIAKIQGLIEAGLKSFADARTILENEKAEEEEDAYEEASEGGAKSLRPALTPCRPSSTPLTAST